MGQFLFFAILSFTLLAPSSAKGVVGQVVMVQAVSTDKTSFVIRKGAKDGVNQWQEYHFSNKKTSFYARAIEVNRYYSLWQIGDTRGKVPFAKGEFVDINPLAKKWKGKGKGKLGGEKEGEGEEEERQLVFTEILPDSLQGFIFRSHYTIAIGEAISKVDGGRQEGRHGLQWEIVYWQVFNQDIDIGVGFRFDREISRLLFPTVEAVTHRYLLTTEFNYHFDQMEQSSGHFYFGVGGGIGLSRTEVQGPVESGRAFSFPIVRLGHHYQLQSYSLLFEISGENVSSTEKFTDEEKQHTSVTNLKFSLGLKF